MTVVPLQYRFDGPEDAPTVLLLPPLGTRWSVWEPQMPELTRRYRVLRVNHRGHGESPAPSGGYTVAELGGDVLSLLDEHGVGRLSIIGSDLGGALATWVATAAPGRVRSLFHLTGTARTPRAHWWRAVGERAVNAGMAEIASEVTRSWFTPAFAQRCPDVVSRMVGEFRELDPAGYAGCCAAFAELDQRRLLARVGAPTMVVSAAHDPFLPPGHGRRLADGIAGARFEVVSGAAHLVGIERRDRVNELVRQYVAG